MLTEVITVTAIKTLRVGDELTDSGGTKFLVIETLFPPTGTDVHHTSRWNLFNTDRLCACAFEQETLAKLTEHLKSHTKFTFNVTKRSQK